MKTAYISSGRHLRHTLATIRRTLAEHGHQAGYVKYALVLGGQVRHHILQLRLFASYRQGDAVFIANKIESQLNEVLETTPLHTTQEVFHVN